ncbi:MAG: FecR family protein [Campylobacterota bacterium]|nr:FecR family protein [Campylobacterota bacterium]
MKKIVLLLLFLTVTLFGSIGKVTGMMGDANIERNSKKLKIVDGIGVEKNDILNTSKNAKVQITFNDNSIVAIGKNSTLHVEDYLFDTKTPTNSKTSFKFSKGTFKTITGKIGKFAPKRFKLATKNATIGIRGSIGVGSQTFFACTQGGYNVSAQGVTRGVNAGMGVETLPGKPPSVPKPFTPSQIDALTNGTNMTTTPQQDAASAGDSSSKKSEEKTEEKSEEKTEEKSEEKTEEKY